MMERNITLHVSKDRIPRSMLIMETIGTGTRFIKECRQVGDDGLVSWQCLTDTGVLMVLSEDKKVCVTFYIASQPKVSAMYNGNTPSWVFNLIRKNKELAKIQNNKNKIEDYLGHKI